MKGGVEVWQGGGRKVRRLVSTLPARDGTSSSCAVSVVDEAHAMIHPTPLNPQCSTLRLVSANGDSLPEFYADELLAASTTSVTKLLTASSESKAANPRWTTALTFATMS